MKRELIINTTPTGHRIALLEQGKLMEYHVESFNTQFTVGDICLGTVQNIAPNPDLNACFITIPGYDEEGFLHYTHLGPRYNTTHAFVNQILKKEKPNYQIKKQKLLPELPKSGKITEVLKEGDTILVQVAKEPISTKKLGLSGKITLAGRHLILMPFSNHLSISRKITNVKERKRLFQLINTIKPDNFGIVVRTAAAGKKATLLQNELTALRQRWINGLKKIKKTPRPHKLIGEISRAFALLRDTTFNTIVVDDPKVYKSINAYLKSITVKPPTVRHYQGKTKLFQLFKIEKQIKALFGENVNLDKGGYLIIQHTEAMHVIDVNTGGRNSEAADHESATLAINLDAAKEIARQLRLRDIGGIIVIDFIDMKKVENRKKVFLAMKEFLAADKAKLLPLSPFCLMQITRKRVRPEMTVKTTELCLSCNGTGQMNASILIAEHIESQLHNLITQHRCRRLTIVLHPYLHAFFTVGLYSKRMRWFWKYKQWVRLIKDSSMSITDYRFLDKKGKPIDID